MKKMKEVGLASKLCAGLFIAVLVLCVFSAAFCPVALAVTTWSKTYGGTGTDKGYGDLVQTSDGGYVISGDTSSFGAGGSDYWLIKVDAAGNMLWNKTYGGNLTDVENAMVQTSDGGYALLGNTNSFGAGGNDFWLVKTDAAGNMQWNKTYGGNGSDIGISVFQTSDGGYALAGLTYSFGAGGADVWLVKTDANGSMLWNRTYGGTGSDGAYSVVQTSDGGYALSGPTTSFGAGSTDIWLFKTDSAGNMQWNKTYGGPLTESMDQMIRTADGGYAICGYTSSFGAGGTDVWLIKTDATGNLVWNKTYGGTLNDNGFHLLQTADGFAVIGSTYSFGAGGADFWLIKTDLAGNMLWNQTYGGTEADVGYSIIQTSDGGYALAGNTNSFGAGGSDFYVIKTDSAGVAPGLSGGWSKTYGGAGNDNAWGDVIQTSDGGYAISGDTYSFGAGNSDYWLVKTDAAGIMLWNKTYGGPLYESESAMIMTSDGGFALAGSYNATNAALGAGGDFWLVKTDASGNMLWNKTYGGTGNEISYSVVQTSDGGYALAGLTTSFGAGGTDGWLVKTDAAGNMLWNKTYGGNGTDAAYFVVAASDGGYALGGYTNSFGAGGNDFWLVKTDGAGNVVWNKTYGGASPETAMNMVQTTEGGYALAGYTASFGAGGTDAWLVKTDANGNMLWNKTYGGNSTDRGIHVLQAADGYIIVGYTDSFGAGGWDLWLIKTDVNGNVQWNKTYGGTGNEQGWSLCLTNDGGYAATGYTTSFGAGGQDFYFVKTNGVGVVPEFPSWLILSLALVATGFIVFGKKTILRRRYTRV